MNAKRLQNLTSHSRHTPGPSEYAFARLFFPAGFW